MPNQFLSPEGDIENYFVSEYWLIDQYIGDELWVWGYNSYGGNLGDATTITKNTPVTTFAGGTQWKQVSASRFNTAAIKTDGTLWTWGRGDNGELGNASLSDSSTPITTFAGGTDWKQVTGGSGFNAAIKTDGTLWTWGFNQHIGIDDGINRSTPITTFVGGSDWKQVSGGWFHTLAVKTDGTLWTWGRNDEGELGIGEPPSYTISTPVTTFAGGTNWADTPTTEPEDLYTLSAGSSYTTAIKTDGTLWTWGRNNYGTLGDIIFRGVRKTPGTTFAGGTNWKQVSAGGKHTSAVKTDGTLWTWGRGDNGVLGTNDTTNRSTPVTTFAGGTNWNQVNSSNTHTTAIKTDGTLWIWGNKSLIPIDNNSRSTPITTISGGTNWADTSTSEPEDLYTLSAGFSFVSAIKTDGTLWSWGNAFFGQIGNASNVTQEFPSTTFAGGTNWKQVSTSDSATAAIKTDGTLWTWGYEFSGQLGNANTSNGVSGRKSTPLTTFAGGTNWKQVSVSNFNTAAIKTDGTLWVWGSGSFGRLGTNDTTNRSTPVTTFTGGTNWKQVSVGGQHTAAIKTDGTLWVWGSQDSGCLGNGFIISNRFTPVTTFAGGTNWKQVSAGNNYTAAIKTDGTLWIWGGGIYGQLGNFTTPLRESTPVTTFAGGTNWKQVSAGFNHTTAVKTDGTLWTWGRNNYGKLGVNNTTNRSTPVTTFAGGTNWKQVGSGGSLTVALKDDGSNKELFIFGGPGNVLGIGFDNRIPNSIPQTDWKQVSAGGSHTVAIKTDGTLWTWGVNINGGLGTNDTTNRSTPVTTFTGGTNWKQVSAGGSHTAAVKTDGTLWTWGSNGFISPLLGTNDTAHRFTPVTTFAGGTNWKQVSAGSLHTAAIKTDGTLWTWGFGNSGRLGTNDITSRSTPVTTFTGGTNWKQVSVGDSHTVALKDDGVNKELFLFGLGTSGELGNALSINDTYIPNKVGNSSDWKQAAGGRLHSAAIKTDGTLWIWGYNGFSRDPGGVLGTGSIDSFSIFTPVTTLTGGTDWKSIQCGANHNIAIKTDGSLWTWGNSLYGQLGNGEELFKKIPVTTFAGGTNWADTATTEPEDLYTLSAGFNHRAAIKTDGTLWVWGSNLKGFSGINGKLGTNDGITRSTPSTTFAGGTNWKQISLGYNHSAGIKTDGTLWVWGNSDLGELGNASFNSSFTPITTFAGGSNWKQVSAGGKHTAAIKTDGTLWGWGDNTVGQLGTNGITITSTPVTTFAGGTNWKQVSSEGYHTAAVKTDGTLWIWGPQNSGKLGNNIFSSSIVSTPITTFAGGTNWKQVSTNDNNTAAIKTDGTLWIWGDSDILASNDAISRSTPITTFAGGTNWKQVSLGRFHAAAVKTNGTLWTWGNGYYGELGNNDRTLFSGMSTPVTTFAGGTNWKQVSAGGEITIALRDDGLNKELYVFGSNAELYELGLGTINSIQPSKVGNSTDWKQASGGYGVTSAVKIDGTLWTWGYNAFGELGNNSVEDYIYRFYTPITTFAGGNNWRQVSCGRNSVYAVKTGIIPDLPLS